MNLGIYIHIPFCVRKCNYCDFLSFPAHSTECISDYMKALIWEIELWKETVSAYEVDTIFIGGGTPSLLSERELGTLFDSLYKYLDLSFLQEFSMECNPGTVTEEKLWLCHEAGVNRLSFGMQSAIEKELKKLGRIHTYDEFVQGYEWARRVGFSNINVDLMAAIPEQTLSSYEESLRNVCALSPEHISSYSLIIEEGTPFYTLYGKNPPVDEETDREMYEMTSDLLEQHGYKRYEISNYARRGMECKHNLKYWKRSEYIGIGLGASSFLNEKRFSNERELSAYSDKIRKKIIPVVEEEIISREEAIAEFMYLGLRCMEGVSESEFEQHFSCKLMEVYGKKIHQFIKEKLLVQRGERIALTKRGIDVSNRVFSEFL